MGTSKDDRDIEVVRSPITSVTQSSSIFTSIKVGPMSSGRVRGNEGLIMGTV